MVFHFYQQVVIYFVALVYDLNCHQTGASQEQLRNVRSLSATHRAFAALLEDGSVVCWGDSYNGGSCETEQELIMWRRVFFDLWVRW